jgi:hypothetical protein
MTARAGPDHAVLAWNWEISLNPVPHSAGYYSRSVIRTTIQAGANRLKGKRKWSIRSLDVI